MTVYVKKLQKGGYYKIIQSNSYQVIWYMIGLGTSMNSGFFFLSRQDEHILINVMPFTLVVRIKTNLVLQQYWMLLLKSILYKKYSFLIIDSLYITPWFTHTDQ